MATQGETVLLRVVVFASLGMAILSSATSFLSYILLAAFSFLGYRSALQALALSWLITALSPAFSAAGEASSLGKPLVFLAVAISVSSRTFASGYLRVDRGAIFTLLIGIVLVIHSVFFSQMIDVSVLKAVIWSTVATSIFLAFSKLSYGELEELSAWLYRGSVSLMIISWPLVVMPEGYLRNGRGFQGVLNHPQTWSVLMAFLCTWTAARIINTRKPSRNLIIIFISSIVSLFLSQGRTGGLALVLSISLAMVCMLLLVRKGNLLRGLRSKQIAMPLLLILLMLLLTTDRWVPAVSGYVFKRAQYNTSDFSGLYETSRGRLVDRALQNFDNSPLTGVGFGIDVSREMEISRDPVFGLPVSAPIEKGNAFVASLGEVGLIVSFLLVTWLSYFFRRALRGGLIPLSIFLCSLFINLGEAVFFSPGGNGLLALLLFGWASYQAPRGKIDAYD